MNILLVTHEILELIINGGLRVVMGSMPLNPGDEFAMQDIAKGDEPDRIFFGRVTHKPITGSDLVQFELKAFMNGRNAEGKIETYPMTGEFANEKYSTPVMRWDEWILQTVGEKPVWIFEGIKWMAEISIGRLIFKSDKKIPGTDSVDFTPEEVTLNISAKGGAKTAVYKKVP